MTDKLQFFWVLTFFIHLNTAFNEASPEDVRTQFKLRILRNFLTDF